MKNKTPGRPGGFRQDAAFIPPTCNFNGNQIFFSSLRSLSFAPPELINTACSCGARKYHIKQKEISYFYLLIKLSCLRILFAVRSILIL